MPRNRRYKRRDYQKRQLKFRSGQLDATGSGKPWTPHTKTIKDVASASFTSSDVGDTKHGVHYVFNPQDYNMPFNTTNGFGLDDLGSLPKRNHPSKHTNALADLYKLVSVKDCMYRFTIKNGIANGTVGEDYVFAYKFAGDFSVTSPDFTDATTVQDFWADMRCSSGWVYRRFSGTQAGGSLWPAAGIIDVKIPSMAKLAYALNEGTAIEDQEDPFLVVLDDANVIKFADIPFALHILIFQVNGTNAPDGTWDLDVDYFCTAKLMRNTPVAELIQDPGAGG